MDDYIFINTFATANGISVTMELLSLEALLDDYGESRIGEFLYSKCKKKNESNCDNITNRVSKMTLNEFENIFGLKPILSKDCIYNNFRKEIVEKYGITEERKIKTEIISNKKSIKSKDLIPGYSYTERNGNKFVYLGKGIISRRIQTEYNKVFFDPSYPEKTNWSIKQRVVTEIRKIIKEGYIYLPIRFFEYDRIKKYGLINEFIINDESSHSDEEFNNIVIRKIPKKFLSENEKYFDMSSNIVKYERTTHPLYENDVDMLNKTTIRLI